MKAVLFVAALLVAHAAADCYLQYPPGSNDRNRERRDNRNNGNRLFDSQNNAQGGYAWRGDATVRAGPDPLTYYVGSLIRMEWTNQHACGPNPNVHCELVIQYACEDALPGLRDGYPNSDLLVESDNNNPGYRRRQFATTACEAGRTTQNQDGTNTIPDNCFQNDPVRRNRYYNLGELNGVEFGMHENYDWYQRCRTTERNRGLYTSDQTVRRNDQRGTRQNPNGNRRGLECPEERDYWPWWQPTPWTDVAVLTSNLEYCDYFQSNSENVTPRGRCSQCGPECLENARTMEGCGVSRNLKPIREECCTGSDAMWEEFSKNKPKPDCLLHEYGRDNHLGNTSPVDAQGNLVLPSNGDTQPEAASYTWRVPADAADQLCILRVRYNMSTEDYPSHAYAEPGTETVGFNSEFNCPRIRQDDNDDPDADPTASVDDTDQCTNRLTVNNRPLFNRPYINVFGSNFPRLSLAINTHQTGRTFQDRTHVFRVAHAPRGVAGRTIWNLNARGRRGNIVQAYPAVEYDFHPSNLVASQNDWLHIQFHGSDFNAAKNANNGEGWQYSDRFNILEMPSETHNYMLAFEEMQLFRGNEAIRWALLEQDPAQCDFTIRNGHRNEQNNINNCGKLNRAPNTFPTNPAEGLVSLGSYGARQYSYFSSRNNNFSNRSQKATLTVTPASTGLTTAEAAGVGVGVTAGVLLAVAGVCFYGSTHPHSRAGALYSKASGAFSGLGAASTAGKTATPAPPDMEYTRH